ncbi:MAG TPA: GNAT family N-acetyltransferase [Firmicutes bacterium]|nr:GNAT family N-acetyltransferase [Bacillota bacterium]
MVILRRWTAADAASIARFADNPKIAANLRDLFPSPYTREDAESYAAYCCGADESRELLRVIEVDGAAAGNVSLTLGGDVYRRSAELGYWLAEDFWGRGIMTEAVKEICRLGFERWAIVRIYAEPFARNAASRRVLEKAGFSLEGVMRAGVCKGGEILDYCMYSLLRTDRLPG